MKIIVILRVQQLQYSTHSRGGVNGWWYIAWVMRWMRTPKKVWRRPRAWGLKKVNLCIWPLLLFYGFITAWCSHEKPEDSYSYLGQMVRSKTGKRRKLERQSKTMGIDGPAAHTTEATCFPISIIHSSTTTCLIRLDDMGGQIMKSPGGWFCPWLCLQKAIQLLTSINVVVALRHHPCRSTKVVVVMSKCSSNIRCFFNNAAAHNNILATEV